MTASFNEGLCIVFLAVIIVGFLLFVYYVPFMGWQTKSLKVGVFCDSYSMEGSCSGVLSCQCTLKNGSTYIKKPLIVVDGAVYFYEV